MPWSANTTLHFEYAAEDFRTSSLDSNLDESGINRLRSDMDHVFAEKAGQNPEDTLRTGQNGVGFHF